MSGDIDPCVFVIYDIVHTMRYEFLETERLYLGETEDHEVEGFINFPKKTCKQSKNCGRHEGGVKQVSCWTPKNI